MDNKLKTGKNDDDPHAAESIQKKLFDYARDYAMDKLNKKLDKRIAKQQQQQFTSHSHSNEVDQYGLLENNNNIVMGLDEDKDAATIASTSTSTVHHHTTSRHHRSHRRRISQQQQSTTRYENEKRSSESHRNKRQRSYNFNNEDVSNESREDIDIRSQRESTIVLRKSELKSDKNEHQLYNRNILLLNNKIISEDDDVEKNNLNYTADDDDDDDDDDSSDSEEDDSFLTADENELSTERSSFLNQKKRKLSVIAKPKNELTLRIPPPPPLPGLSTNDLDKPKSPLSYLPGVHGHHGTGSSPVDYSGYIQKKSLAQGMMDLALVSANTNQLRYIIEYREHHPYFATSLTLVISSLFLQLAVGMTLIWNTRFNVKRRNEMKEADRVNNFSVIGIFMVTLINVFLSTFGGAPSSAASAASATESSLSGESSGVDEISSSELLLANNILH